MSDTLNGVGLLIIGVLVPVLGLIRLGGGDLAAGLARLTTEHTGKLNAIGSADDPTPFGTLFTGMIFANLFYWGTNQYVIQRTLGAASLAEGQKGVLISGFFKIAVPFLMMIPGVIAFHLYGPTLTSMDDAYPRLAADVLPGWLSGFFLAVLLGAVLSSFNSLLNSASTLFAVDLVAPFRQTLSDAALIRIARIFGTVLALGSFLIAPMLQYAPEGVWQLIRKFTGFYNIPIIAIVMMAVLTSRTHHRVPAAGALTAIGFHLVAYGLLTFGSIRASTSSTCTPFCLRIEVADHGGGFAWRSVKGRASLPPAPQSLDMTPWRWAYGRWRQLLLAAMVGVYVLFSGAGLARAG